MAQRQHQLVQRRQAPLRARLADQALHGQRIAAGIGRDRFDLRAAADALRTRGVVERAADARVRVVVQPGSERIDCGGAGIGQRVNDCQPRRLGARRVQARRYQCVQRARGGVGIVGDEMRPDRGHRGGGDGRIRGEEAVDRGRQRPRRVPG